MPQLLDVLDALVKTGNTQEAPTREEALQVLSASDDDLLDIVAAAFRVRREHFGRRVKLNSLINMKSGLCPEDCGYCSQRRGSDADVLKYTWVSTEEALENARRAVDAGARRVCLVASGRGPSDKDIDRIAETIGAVKEFNDSLEVCVCLGLLKDGQAQRLREAGAFAYNHNLNTNEDNYGKICSTHTFDDRVDTVNKAAVAGLSPCSGAIFGMGESDEDIVDLAFSLRELQPDSVPINFLMPFEGTPLAGTWELTPARCIRILAVFRFMFPNVEVRVAGGREIHLRSLQPMALYIANSIFLGDYLTSEGDPGADDIRMILDAGFTIEGMTEEQMAKYLPKVSPGSQPVSIRRRGVGTDIPSNV